MRRLFTLTVTVLLLFGSVAGLAYADDGSGCAHPPTGDYGLMSR